MYYNEDLVNRYERATRRCLVGEEHIKDATQREENIWGGGKQRHSTRAQKADGDVRQKVFGGGAEKMKATGCMVSPRESRKLLMWNLPQNACLPLI